MDRTYFKNLSESLWDHNNDAHYFRDKPKPDLAQQSPHSRFVAVGGGQKSSAWIGITLIYALCYLIFQSLQRYTKQLVQNRSLMNTPVAESVHTKHHQGDLAA